MANPYEICLALANEAMDKGVRVLENCQVNIILVLIDIKFCNLKQLYVVVVVAIVS